MRRFESLGVQATIEVQAAGRKVAAENALLRKLLRRHGVTQEEIRGYLETHTMEYTPCDEDPTEPQPRAISQSPTAQGDPRVGRSIVQPTSSLPEDNRPSHGTTYRETALPPLSDSTVRGQMDPLGGETFSAEQLTARGIPFPDDFKIEQLSDRRHTGQSMPCDTAARIITNMRGCPDIREVRSELGCHSESNCMVRNMDIFEILDK